MRWPLEVEGGVSGKRLGDEDALIKQTPESSRALSTMWGPREKMAV